MKDEAERAAKQPDVPKEEKITLLLIMIGVAVGLWALYWWGVDALISDSAQRGTFGDKFGGVNALFAALAFAGLIYTVLLQKRELGYQRQELIQTRKEIAGQRKQMQLQNATLRRQSFENTFFQLLRLHHEIVAGMQMPTGYGSPSITGRRSFRALYDELQEHFKRARQDRRADTPREIAETAYRWLYDERQELLGHYFRNMYHMVKLAHQAKVRDKKKYTSLVRAQLSGDEHVLLFYNGLSQFGNEKFAPLIEEYALLENMPVERLEDPKTQHDLYLPAAYGSDWEQIQQRYGGAG